MATGFIHLKNEEVAMMLRDAVLATNRRLIASPRIPAHKSLTILQRKVRHIGVRGHEMEIRRLPIPIQLPKPLAL